MQEYAEFCLASIEFLIKYNASITAWMDNEARTGDDFKQSPMYYPHFIEWVSTQAARFPNLNAHLEKMK
jgi:hypothetical protein